MLICECADVFIEFVIRASGCGMFFSVFRLPLFCKVQCEKEVRDLKAGRSLSKF